ncbi:Adenosylcobinamide-phosphate guanylyltransferase [Pseudoalteromonas luteoviolacea B = ATCC 29581]|nr:Adenosylcobinamide-phosphate guanylyltransferase [Pseudoalteromonas luteoviolacea B = ATCC 29581]
MSVTLLIGGARSGKSKMALARAKALAVRLNRPLYYVATASAKDDEMRERIERHQQERDAHWQTIETPFNLSTTLGTLPKQSIVVIDCLTLWLSNWLCEKGLAAFQDAKRELLSALQTSTHSLFLVSNEVGHGIVPLGELSRTFVDESGWLHQDLAAFAERVDFVMAGLSVTLKAGSER